MIIAGKIHSLLVRAIRWKLKLKSAITVNRRI